MRSFRRLSQRFDSSLSLELRASPLVIAGLTLGHVGAALLTIPLPLALPWQIVIWLLLAGSLAYQLHKQGTRHARRAITGVLLEPDGELSVRFGTDKRWHGCRIVSQVVHPWITFLRLRCANRRFADGLIIAADATDSDSLRRLRARLRLGNLVD